MAKEVAVGKRAKISEAQQYMLMSVLGAAIILGIAIRLVLHFIDCISFNTKVIMEQEKSIVSYSNIIKDAGICKKPRGSIYSDDELRKCNPDAIQLSEIPGTLRANILQGLAANKALNSVPKESNSACVNQETQKQYTYDELNELYSNAKTSEELQLASTLIKNCSALRIIPEALPAFKNEEALLASVNQLFIASKIEPNGLYPAGTSGTVSYGKSLHSFDVRFLMPEDSTVSDIMTLFDNIQRSVREFRINRANLNIEENGDMEISTQGTAYYMDGSSIAETTVTVKPEGSAAKK